MVHTQHQLRPTGRAFHTLTPAYSGPIPLPVTSPKQPVTFPNSAVTFPKRPVTLVRNTQLAFGSAAARLISLFGSNTVFGNTFDAEDTIRRAHGLLKVMESELAARPFLVGSAVTLADVAMYSYTVSAPEGNVDLGPYRNVRAWLARIEGLPGFVAFAKTPVGLAA